MHNKQLRLWCSSVCILLLVGTIFLARVLAADPAGRTPRTIALTCCERCEETWAILSSWQRSCARAAARPELTTEKYVAMLSLQSHFSVPATAVSSVCEAKSLSRSAIAAYFPYALCASIPRTHVDLARSVYSPLMDEAPTLEDELIDDIESACRNLQSRWTAELEVWATQLRTETKLSVAQAALCPSPCRWREDAIDGGTYDL
ncbi:hypothetical protein ABL78_8065 [Leptomonas seymouri]|uniref:Uncharacterized protein n=1 Tax=Leptomonas seymouri TaxID=5684 RepID=A0A0N1P962_LEPSE|nr:hypothetical protein ABL78_8065 [Leptomonas seymouri]|eukprot:KPI82920.1 hypothetical protein ABL78_8065 [Leptomonas seymouri]